MFRGFTDTKLPSYEILTPQTKQTFMIRSMTVSEEERLKGSFVISVKMIDHLNSCLYKSISSFPPNIKSYEDFLKNVSTIDREALLYGLYHISYDEVKNYDITCGQCEKVYPINVNISDIFSICVYPGDDNILQKRIPVSLPVFSNVKVFIKQPTLEDEFNILKSYAPNLGQTSSIAQEILIIDKFQDFDSSGELVNEYSSTEDIIDAYRNLNVRDKRKIQEEYKNNFSNYSIDLKMNTICPICSHTEEIRVDLVSQFFRMVHSG